MHEHFSMEQNRSADGYITLSCHISAPTYDRNDQKRPSESLETFQDFDLGL